MAQIAGGRRRWAVGGRLVAIASVAVLAAGTVALQAARDGRYGALTDDARMMYLQSPEVADRLALEYDAVAADV